MVDPAGDTVARSDREPAAADGGLVAGEQLGKYRLERVVGSGGMGVVWAARDPDLERDVAIKVLRGNADADLRRRLLREARAMAKVRHPNVLTIYEASSDGGRDYIAMELVEGGDLERWLTTRPPRTQIWDALLAAGRGLAAAHAAGLVHRDFKPHNVLRERDGRVVVTDFGLARDVAEDRRPGAASSPGTVDPVAAPLDDTLEALASSDPLTSTRLTRAGALVGTPAYMAPEQLDGGAADARADQFAFCITAWQALAGARPFTGGTIDELRRAVRAAPAPAAELPRAVRAVLERGLDPDPARRWADLGELLAALTRTAAPAVWKRFALLAMASATASAALVLIALPRLRPRALAAGACRSPEAAFGAVWPPSPEIAARLHGGAAARLSSVLDDFRSDWLAAYKSACTEPAPRLEAVHACLTGERDEIAAVARLLALHPDAADRLEPTRIVPDIGACTGAVPTSIPAIPAAQRDAIVAERAMLLDAMTAPPARAIDGELDQLRAATTAWGAWDPLTAEIDEGLGVIARARGKLEDARAHFRAVADLADQCGHARLAALARIDLVALEMQVAADPTIDALSAMIDTAGAAVHHAGDDAGLSVELDALEAELWSDRGDIDRAVGPFTRGMLIMSRHSDPVLMERMMATIVDQSADVAPVTLRAIKKARKQPAGPDAYAPSARDLAISAWITGDLDDMHEAFDHAAGPRPAPAGPAVSGRVLRPDGTPAAGARVVAWTGELAGDGRRVYSDPRTLAGDVATTDAAGRFTVHAPPGAAVIAEQGDLRSSPRLLGSGGDVALVATRTVTGTCAPRVNSRVDAFVRFVVGDATWEVKAPVVWHERFTIDRVPPGGVVGAVGTVGPHATRRVLAVDGDVAWPAKGPAVDVIEHGGTAPGPHDAWLFRGTLVARTRAEVEAAARTRDVAHASLGPIGDVTTEEGRRAYHRGDLHAVFRSTPAGPATACVVDGTAPLAPARCVAAEPAASETSYAVTLEPPR